MMLASTLAFTIERRPAFGRRRRFQEAAAGLRPSQGGVFCHLPASIVTRVAAKGKGRAFHRLLVGWSR